MPSILKLIKFHNGRVWQNWKQNKPISIWQHWVTPPHQGEYMTRQWKQGPLRLFWNYYHSQCGCGHAHHCLRAKERNVMDQSIVCHGGSSRWNEIYRCSFPKAKPCESFGTWSLANSEGTCDCICAPSIPINIYMGTYRISYMHHGYS